MNISDIDAQRLISLAAAGAMAGAADTTPGAVYRGSYPAAMDHGGLVRGSVEYSMFCAGYMGALRRPVVTRDGVVV